MSITERISEYLHQHREEILRDLGALCAIPSVRGEAQPGAPVGVECNRCLETAAQLFRDNGFEAKVFNDSAYALAWYGEGEKTLGVFGHLDVVPVNARDWTMTAPFEMVEKDGFLYCRGVGDNKSSTIASLYVLRALRDLNIPVKNRFVIFMGGAEETDMTCIKNFAEEQPMPNVSLVPDGGYPTSLGESTILQMDIVSSRAFDDVLALEGGTAYNIVLPEVKCVLKNKSGAAGYLAAAGAEWLSFEEKDDVIELTAKGLAVHAGSAPTGDSALRRLSALLADCEALTANDRGLFACMARALSDAYGSEMGIDYEDPNFGRLTAGNGIVALENGCPMFTIDIRQGVLLPTEEAKRRIAEKLADGEFTARVFSDSPGFVIDADSPLTHAVMDAYREISGDYESMPHYVKGGTYARSLKNAYSIGICYGGGEGPALPQGHGGAHQPDERMSIEGYFTGVSMLAAMMLALDEKL